MQQQLGRRRLLCEPGRRWGLPRGKSQEHCHVSHTNIAYSYLAVPQITLDRHVGLLSLAASPDHCLPSRFCARCNVFCCFGMILQPCCGHAVGQPSSDECSLCQEVKQFTLHCLSLQHLCFGRVCSRVPNNVLNSPHWSVHSPHWSDKYKQASKYTLPDAN